MESRVVPNGPQDREAHRDPRAVCRRVRATKRAMADSCDGEANQESNGRIRDCKADGERFPAERWASRRIATARSVGLAASSRGSARTLRNHATPSSASPRPKIHSAYRSCDR